MTWFKCKRLFIRSEATWWEMCLLFVLVPISVLAATEQPYQAKVIGIADGDTITVLQGTTQIKIRLYGIDCPESHQAFGNKAKQFTSNLVFGHTVKVEPVTKDRYGRTVAWVYVESKCLNEELLKFHWGLVPFWAKDSKIGYKMVNARAETVATKPSSGRLLKNGAA